MKTDKNILIAFLLNLIFSILEFIGGVFTNSVAIMSDAVHDLGDAISIGFSYFLERKSKKKADQKYTYGYHRYSTLGACITSCILLIGSIFVVIQSVNRLINPVSINYNGMLIFAVFGVVVNFTAAYITKDGDSLNQKAVNLHMLEDVLGWIVVLIGALVMKFTNISIIDPIMSICVAGYICFNAIHNILEVLSIFLEKAPNNISIDELKKHLFHIKGVIDIHHLHIWKLNETTSCATLHVVVKKQNKEIKDKIREEFKEHNIAHVTIELELENEECENKDCCIDKEINNHTHSHCHHHHHH